MKKIARIFLYISLIAIVALCCFACTQTQTPTGGSSLIEGELPGFNRDDSLIYGEEPDLDNVIIDGKLDDELWKDKKWYTQYTENTRASFYFTTAFSEKGLYVAAYSKDQFVMYLGRNYFYSNTQLAFYVDTPKGRSLFRIDANNLKPTTVCLNARSLALGEINSTIGGSIGLNAEFFITWKEMGFESKPESVLMFPYYGYKAKLTDQLQFLYPTFVKVLSNGTDEYLTFNENGYPGGDEAGATVGSHDIGLAKTQGFIVSKDENGKEVTETTGKTYSYPQAAFFRSSLATNFMIKAKMKVRGLPTSIGRAGLLIYKNDIAYRSLAIELTDKNYKDGKLSNLAVNAYTNYPANVTVTDRLAEIANSNGDDTVDLMIFGNNGNLFYIINGVYLYSEVANYVGTNCMFGFYAFNADVEFTDYECVGYKNDDEVRAALSTYAYTVNVVNKVSSRASVAVDQIGVSTDGNGQVELTFTTTPGYTVNPDELYYTKSNGEKVDLYPDVAKNISYGVYVLKNIDDNITITCGYTEDKSEKVDLKIRFRNKSTGQSISAFKYQLIGSGMFTRYNVNGLSNDGISIVSVPKGMAWKYVTGFNGYRVARGELLGGEVVSENMENEYTVDIEYPVLGGTATSPTSEFKVESNKSIYWDTTKEEEGEVTFQTTNNGYSYVYFSGPTISEYHVAYIEITNQTDPTAFTSMERDPAVGFTIQSRSNVGFIGMRMGNGLRILPHGMSDFGNRVDTSALVSGYDGYLVSTSDGVVQGLPFMGKGTVDRVSYNNREDTTSMLLIRSKGKLLVYLADKSQNVKPTKASLDASNMEKIYEYENEAFAGEAAIGIGVTVSYNLKIKYSNCWILSGAQAREFSNDLVSSPLNVEFEKGADEYAEFVGDGLIDVNDKGVPGRVATGSTITVRAKTGLPANQLMRVRLNNNTTKYIAAGDSTSFVIDKANMTYNMECTLVNAVKVTGSLKQEKDVDFAKAKGTVYQNGDEISTFKVNNDGSFGFLIPKGRGVDFTIGTDGYSTKMTSVSASSTDVNVGELTMVSLTIGGAVTAPGGVTLTSNSAYTYNVDAEGNPTATYYTTDSASTVTLAIKSQPMIDAVVKFSYTRKSASASGVSKKDETDLGLGLQIHDGSADHRLLMIGNGVRLFATGQNFYADAYNERGLAPIDIAATNVTKYDIMYIKKGSTVYLYSKNGTATDYSLVYVWQAMDNGSEVLSTESVFAIYMTTMPGSFMNITFSDVSIEPLTAENDQLIRTTFTANSGANGKIVVDKNSGGYIAANGNVYDVYKSRAVKFSVVPNEGYLIANITIDGVKYDMQNYTGGSYDITVNPEKAMTVSAEFLSAASIKLISGSVKDQYGQPVANYTLFSDAGFTAVTDRNGNFNGMYANSDTEVKFLSETQGEFAELNSTVKAENGKFNVVAHRMSVGGAVTLGGTTVYSGNSIWESGTKSGINHGYVFKVDENGNETAECVDETITRAGLMFTGVSGDKLVARASIKWSQLHDTYPIAGFIFRNAQGGKNGIGVYGEDALGMADVRTWNGWQNKPAKEKLGFVHVTSLGGSGTESSALAIKTGKVDMAVVYDNGYIDYYVRFPETQAYNKWFWLYSGMIFGDGGLTGGVAAVGLTETSEVNQKAHFVWSDFSAKSGQAAIDEFYAKEITAKDKTGYEYKLTSDKIDNTLAITPTSGKMITSVTLNGKPVVGTVDKNGVYTLNMTRDLDTSKYELAVTTADKAANVAMTGKVTLLGAKAAGVTVQAALNGSVVTATATTDANGAYSLSVPAGKYVLILTKEGALNAKRSVEITTAGEIETVDMTPGVTFTRDSRNGKTIAAIEMTYDEEAENQLATLVIHQKVQGAFTNFNLPMAAKSTLSFSFKAGEGHSYNRYGKYVDMDEYLKWHLAKADGSGDVEFGFQSSGNATGKATTVNNVFGDMEQDIKNRVYNQYDIKIVRDGASVSVYAKFGTDSDYKLHSTFTVSDATAPYYLYMLNDGIRTSCNVDRTFFNFAYSAN